MRHLFPLAALLFACMISVRPAAGDTMTNWTWKSRIGFPGYTRAETLTNFPVSVRLGSQITNFAYSTFKGTNGADLRFFSADGTRQLDYEIEKWNSNGTSTAWVLLPSLEPSTSFIWACWGNSNALTPPPCTTNGAVWSNGFEAVWHLSEKSGSIADVSRHNYTAAAYGSPLRGTNGVTGDCLHFTYASSDYLTCGAKTGTVISDPTGRSLTFSCWVKPNNFTQNSYVFSSGGQTSSRGISLLLDGNEKPQFSVRTDVRLLGNGSTAPPSPVGAWTHLTFTCTADAGTLTAYMNGMNIGVFSSSVSTQTDNKTDVTLAKPNSTSGYYFGGGIDEPRFETVERSSNWIWACYLNQGSNDSFCLYGEALISGGGPLPSATPLDATSVSGTVATLNGIVAGAAGAESPAVFFLLDSADRGTASTSAWARVIDAGAWGEGLAFSAAADGLIRGSSYVYRIFATNGAGASISASLASFRTVNYCGLSQSAPSQLAFTSALLGGAVTNLAGGRTPTVSLQWTLEGATSSVSLGPQSGPFTYRLEGLTPGGSYDYRFLGENEAGITTGAWDSFSLPNPADWHYRLKIRAAGYNRSETLTNFPLLVKLDASLPGFSAFRSPSPDDLRFTAENGEELPYEIEEWLTNGVSTVWVRVPRLTPGTQLLALGGNAGAAMPTYATNGATWLPEVSAVWHFSQAGSQTDSSRHGYNGAGSLISRGTAGIIGPAVSFVTNNAYIDCGAHPGSPLVEPPPNAPVSLSFWLKPGFMGEFGFPFSSGGQTTSQGYSVRIDPAGVVQLTYHTATYAADLTNQFAVATGAWTLISAVFDGQTFTAYRNGIAITTTNTTAIGYPATYLNVLFGKPSNQNNYYYKGSMDESRVEAVARSSNWVWACWFSQASNSLFNTVSPDVRRGALMFLK